MLQQYVAGNPAALLQYLTGSPAVLEQYVADSPTALLAYLGQNGPAVAQYVAGNPAAAEAYLQANTASFDAYLVASADTLNAYLASDTAARQAYLQGGAAAVLAYVTVNAGSLQQYVAANPVVLQQYLATDPPALQQYLEANPAVVQQYLSADATVLQQFIADNPAALEQYLAGNTTVLQQFLTASPAALEQYLANDPALLQQFLTSDPALLQQFLTADPALLQQFLTSNPGVLQQTLTAAVLNLFRLNVNLPGTGNQASGGLLSTFNIGNGLFTETVTATQLQLLTQAAASGTPVSSYAVNVTTTGGSSTLTGGLLANFTAAGGGNRFVIEDPSLLGLPSGTAIPVNAASAVSSFTGTGSHDSFSFVGGGPGNPIGHVVINEPPGSTGDALDFSGFQGGGVDLNLNQTNEQQLNTGKLWLTLPNAAAFNNVVGSPSADTIIGTGPASNITGALTDVPNPYALAAPTPRTGTQQWVYLDFTTFSPTPIPGDTGEVLHGYSASDQAAVLAGLQKIYGAFPYVQFTTNFADIQQYAPASLSTG